MVSVDPGTQHRQLPVPVDEPECGCLRCGYFLFGYVICFITVSAHHFDRDPQGWLPVDTCVGVGFGVRAGLTQHQSSLPSPRHTLAERFFSLLKTERFMRNVFKDRNADRAVRGNPITFDENPKRRHGKDDWLSSVAFEQQYCEKLTTV